MKTIAIMSGGLDSTVLTTQLVQERGKENVVGMSVDYGQRHGRELVHAAHIANGVLGIEYHVADIRACMEFFNGSSQTSGEIEVPEGHYADESMKLTVVPNRNMVLLALAISLAVSKKAQTVAYGAHAGDHTIYPDCRPEFADAMNAAAALCDWKPIEIERPFIDITKADIVRLGHLIGAPLALTYSCYKGELKHCGKCGTCVERREAFKLAGVPDPTFYEE